MSTWSIRRLQWTGYACWGAVGFLTAQAFDFWQGLAVLMAIVLASWGDDFLSAADDAEKRPAP